MSIHLKLARPPNNNVNVDQAAMFSNMLVGSTGEKTSNATNPARFVFDSEKRAVTLQTSFVFFRLESLAASF
jgi:hypothetical protein